MSPRSEAPGGSSRRWTGSAAPGSSSPRASRSSPIRRAPSPTRQSTRSSSCAPHAWSRVTVRVRDGRTLTAGPRGARGHPDTPLDPDALRAKFRACATLVLPRDEAEGVAEQLAHLEDIPDIRALTSRLAGDLD